jgi:hypothetical protein
MIIVSVMQRDLEIMAPNPRPGYMSASKERRCLNHVGGSEEYHTVALSNTADEVKKYILRERRW